MMMILKLFQNNNNNNNNNRNNNNNNNNNLAKNILIKNLISKMNYLINNIKMKIGQRYCSKD